MINVPSRVGKLVFSVLMIWLVFGSGFFTNPNPDPVVASMNEETAFQIGDYFVVPRSSTTVTVRNKDGIQGESYFFHFGDHCYILKKDTVRVDAVERFPEKTLILMRVTSRPKLAWTIDLVCPPNTIFVENETNLHAFFENDTAEEDIEADFALRHQSSKD